MNRHFTEEGNVHVLFTYTNDSVATAGDQGSAR